MLSSTSFNVLRIPGVVIAIPVLLLVISVVIKGLAKEDGLKFKDFFLGAELALAAMTASFIYCCDVSRKLGVPEAKTPNPNDVEAIAAAHAKDLVAIGNALGLTLISFFIFVIIIGVQQHFEKKNTLETVKGKFWVGGVLNGMGLFTLAMFQLLFT